MNSNIFSSGNKLSDVSSREVDDPTKANSSVATATAVTNTSVDAGIDPTNCKPIVSLAIALDSLEDGNSGQTTNHLPLKLHPAGANSDGDKSKLPSDKQQTNLALPPNAINADTRVLTPDMLPLIDLTQDDIDSIIQQIDGGLVNLQDIYSPSPVQDGIIFHHIVAPKGDPYITHMCMIFNNRGILDLYLNAFQNVIDRHDIVRTAFLWKGLSRPAQVVLRHAKLSINEVALDPMDGPVHAQLLNLLDPREHKIDLAKAPLVRFTTSQDIDGRWVAVQAMHHVIGDQYTLQQFFIETQTTIKGYGAMLESPQPYRNLIAETRFGKTIEEHKAFFTRMLAKVDTAAFPYDIAHTQDDRVDLVESRLVISHELISRLRDRGKKIGVSFARVCHLAWALVLAATSGQRTVVFGTVVSGRRQSNLADRVLGPFINTLPICIDVKEASLEDTLLRIHSTLTELVEHQHASMTLAQHCSNVPADTPLFNSILNFRRSNNSIMSAGSKVGIHFQDVQERTNYPFSMTVDDGTEAKLICQAPSEVDPLNLCRYMEQALTSIADSSSGVLLQDLEILPLKERELLIETWNQTKAASKDSPCTHHVFEQQVVVSPDSVAAVHDGQSLTYNELNERANKLANHLIGLGVKPDTLVALCVERSLAIMIGILAIHKAGGAYLPLDPVYASSRLQDIIADAGPSIVIADSLGQLTLGADALLSLAVVDPNAEYNTSAENPQVRDLTSNHLAYVIYTSGSTGRPKGVMVEHVQVVRLFDATAEWYHFNESDIWMLTHSFSFDVSVWELWGALFHGGKLIIPSHSTIQSPEDMYSLICSQGVTVLNLTPSAFTPIIRVHSESSLTDKLRFVILAGEVLKAASLQPWYAKRSEDSPKIINMYGTTETTVHATYRVMTAEDCHHSVSPIGSRISDLTLHVLNSQGHLSPLGVIGEICIGGLGVARGYLNRPELNAEKFPLDPFSKIHGARLYKTGDLGRLLPDGQLIYLGRNDFQVKIRGFRIELGEIEAQLMDHKLVHETLVVAVGSDDDRRLVAYVVADAVEGLAQQLRGHLVRLLPDYMVPSAFVRMDQFPLTPNGKIDRRALPVPGDSDFARQEYEPPQGEVECAIAAIWTKLLHVDRVSRRDSFFALGGHSLLAVQMISRLHHLGLSVSVRAIFDSLSLAELAQSIGQHVNVVIPPNLITPSTTRITPELLSLISLDQSDIDRIVKYVPGGVANIQDIYALSPLQDGILFHHLMAKNGDPYVLYSSMLFDDRKSLDRYLAVVQQIVSRHDVLRTAFVWKDLSTPAQVVWRNAPLSVTELQLDPAAGPVSKQLKHMFDPRTHRMDLTQAPLMRFVIAPESNGRWIVARLHHHLIGDHSTGDVMEMEIQAFYEGQEDVLPPAQPYRNLIAQARLGMSQEEHELFFNEMLAGIDVPSLPFGITDVHGDGAQVAEASRMMPQDLNNRLRSQAKRLGVSVASLCHVAWAQVVARTSGEQRVVFGTVLAGRMQAATSSDRAMGLFINTLPIRVDLDTDSVEESVRITHTRLAALMEHEHASLGLAQRCSGVTTGMPLFSALLNYRHSSTPSCNNNATYGMEFLESEERNNYPLGLAVEDYGTSLGLTAKCVQPLVPSRICEYMIKALNSISDSLEHTPSMPATQLEVLPAEERQMLIEDWNATQEEYPDHLCLHHLFEQQVERTPEAIAVVHENQSLTYAELNIRANCLAHRLITLGVKPDNLVAICVQRSPAMIIGVLAILKAGAAYVPLDPFYSSDRLRDIISDATPSIVLADRTGRDILGEATIASLTVEDPNTLGPEDTNNPKVTGLTSHHLAYVIYTSGSTGNPKGVMLEHQGAVNLIYDRPALFDIQLESRVLQYTSLGFDHSVAEIFSALRCGASLYLLKDDIRLDRHQLWDYLERHSITHASFTPTLLQDCTKMPALESLKTLIVMGESMPPSQPGLLRTVAPNSTIINEYGPTECSVATTVWKCQGNIGGDQVPIGRPLSNKTIYLLDIYGNPVPLGAIGEMYIGGVGVARGYLNRPDLTAERFITDPFSAEPGARMYKTGDLARYLPDGNIVHMGRNDQQVKIRGFRIELGEIETRLAEHPLVSNAAVVALGEGTNKRLIAYVIDLHDVKLEHSVNAVEASSMAPLALTLRSYLVTRLPEYMVPAAFVSMDTFPLTPNGKLDRKALPVPGNKAFAFQVYEEPRGEIESHLSGIWRELLHVERVGRNDGFFTLGGHSLMALRMIGQVRAKLGIDISLRTLFEAPTIAELAPRLATGATQGESYDVLLPIKPQGSRPPLFCVHPGVGLSWCFTGLLTQLDPDQPLYGLQARGFTSDVKMAETVDEMALDYINQIRRIQPQGPYYLLGYSFGGSVAHTMASYLEEQGERVAFLSMMDTPAPDVMRERRASVQVEDEDEDAKKAHLKAMFFGKMDKYSTDLTTAFLDKTLMVTQNISRISAAARALRVIKGDLLFFRATVLSEGVESLLCPDDWKPYVLGEIEVCDIECEHLQMDSPDPMANIGQVLNRKLNELHWQDQIED